MRINEIIDEEPDDQSEMSPKKVKQLIASMTAKKLKQPTKVSKVQVAEHQPPKR